MHDGMPYNPIQGQGQGHETYKVTNSSIFKIYLLRHFWCELANDKTESTEQYLTFMRSRFLIFVLVFVSISDYELGMEWDWFSLQMLFQLQLHSLGGGGVRSQPSVPYGANFLICKSIVIECISPIITIVYFSFFIVLLCILLCLLLTNSPVLLSCVCRLIINDDDDDNHRIEDSVCHYKVTIDLF